MKTLMALRKEGNVIGNKAEWIPVSDVYHTETEIIKRITRTIIYTVYGEYVICITAEEIAEGLANEPGFFIRDRWDTANLNHHCKVDKARNIIDFFGMCGGLPTIAKSRMKAIFDFVQNKK